MTNSRAKGAEKYRNDLTRSDVAALLRYEPETGNFYWKVDRHGSARAGSKAGSFNDRGYVQIRVHSIRYKAHRLAWLLMTGEWPMNHVDHINGDPSDNRWSNLRDVTNQENCKNNRLSKRNRSGVSGVHWDTHACSWKAQIRMGGRCYSLGYFEDFDAAVQAQLAGRAALGFHPNHGRGEEKCA
ncbi:TPA: HNH endonuclease signature motif containing protein [Pseudomonas aeruginosa]|nr:HNH endonuclease [Pseudomonas aeruginosa]